MLWVLEVYIYVCSRLRRYSRAAEMDCDIFYYSIKKTLDDVEILLSTVSTRSFLCRASGALSRKCRAGCHSVPCRQAMVAHFSSSSICLQKSVDSCTGFISNHCWVICEEHAGNVILKIQISHLVGREVQRARWWQR